MRSSSGLAASTVFSFAARFAARASFDIPAIVSSGRQADREEHEDDLDGVYIMRRGRELNKGEYVSEETKLKMDGIEEEKGSERGERKIQEKKHASCKRGSSKLAPRGT
jgi:hypothetical protein